MITLQRCYQFKISGENFTKIPNKSVHHGWTAKKLDFEQAIEIFVSHKCNNENYPSLVFNDNRVQLTNSQKHLGLILDSNLDSWHLMEYWPPPPAKVTPPNSKISTSPSPTPVVKFFTPTSDWKQKTWRCEANAQTSHPIWLLINTKQSEICRNTISLIQVLTFRLDINE